MNSEYKNRPEPTKSDKILSIIGLIIVAIAAYFMYLDNKSKSGKYNEEETVIEKQERHDEKEELDRKNNIENNIDEEIKDEEIKDEESDNQ